jgi:putative photosynthetic complex assembly protein
LSSHAQPYQHFPRKALYVAALIVATAFVVAGTGSILGPISNPITAASVSSRDLYFEDRADGSVAILDARTGQTLQVALPGTNGFLRATLRGLARERKHQDFGAAVPFRLTGWADGRLTLEDPTTHRTVELEAFGQTNEAVFAQLLPGTETRPQEKTPMEKIP